MVKPRRRTETGEAPRGQGAWSARTIGRPSLGRQMAFRLPTTAGAVLLFGTHSDARPPGAALRPGLVFSLALVALTVAGLAFAWWARLHIGRLWSIAGAACIALGLYIKARIEEGFLREQLGEDAYAAYARRVPMLVPFLKV